MTDLLISSSVDSSVRAIGLAIAVALILSVFRIRSSSTRHAAWSAVALTMLLLPLLARIAPPVNVTVPGPIESLAPDFTARIEVPPVQMPAASRTIRPGTPAAPSLTSSTPTPVEEHQPVTTATALRWSSVALAIYAIGVALLLVRFVWGLNQLFSIRRNSQPIAAHPGVFESTLVATPVTIGLFAPRIILPAEWRAWSFDMLTAVLAHEQEHVARRDPLFAVAARLNCIVFWFHPLAWWLEGRIATLAEHACDDAALKQIAPRSYAETLLDIAANVRRHRGRLVWQGVGVDGDGRLGRRIDRVLAGGALSSEPSRVRRTLVGALCAVAIGTAIACQQQTAKVEPLRENPELAAKLKAQFARVDDYHAARQVTPDQVAALENALERNPEDVATRQKLLTYYAWTGKNTQPWNENVAARKRHALWLVTHHPESDLVRVVRLPRTDDPDGYRELKRLWLRAVETRNTDPRIIANAVWFIGLSEKRVAEQMLVRALAADPDGPNAPRWARNLGRIYSDLVRDADTNNEPDAAWARQKLEDASSPDVLVAAGRHLSQGSRDPAFGMRLLERASQRQGPAAEEARGLLRLMNEVSPNWAAFGYARQDAWPEMLAKSTGIMRLRQLTLLAEQAFMGAEYFDWTLTPRAGKTQWGSQASTNVERDRRLAAEKFAQSKAYAKEAIALALSLPDAEALRHAFRAHIAYGLVVFREGQRAEALRQLAEAAKLPTAEGTISGGWASGLEYRLVFYLLKHGERQTIIDYLERAAQGRSEERRKTMLDMATAIRDGRMPEHYQYLAAHGHL